MELTDRQREVMERMHYLGGELYFNGDEVFHRPLCVGIGAHAKKVPLRTFQALVSKGAVIPTAQVISDKPTYIVREGA